VVAMSMMLRDPAGLRTRLMSKPTRERVQ